jgi:hypothetical protein
MNRIRPLLALAGLLAVACSTLAPIQTDGSCKSDGDCDAGEICALDQGGVCVSSAIAPRGALGFDIIEPATGLRVELAGCETSNADGDVELRVDREQVAQRFALFSTDVQPGPGCTALSGCPLTHGCDESEELCVGPLGATMQLRQGSRLGLEETQSASQGWPLLDEEGMPLPDAPVEFAWARYEGGPISPPTLIDSQPTAPPRARLRRALLGDPTLADHELSMLSRYQCDRTVFGDVRRFGAEPVLGATVSFTIDEPIANAGTVLSDLPLPTCGKDDPCPDGLVCDPVGDVCGYDLTGWRAGEAATNDAGAFRTNLYTYCEDDPQPVRRLLIDVVPPPGSPLPQIQVPLELEFALIKDPNPLLIPDTDLGGTLCVPDWPDPTPVEFQIGAGPVTLATSPGGTSFRCCDTSCLPSAALLGDDAPAPPETCVAWESLRIETSVEDPDPQAWEDAGCLPLADEPGLWARVVTPEDCQGEICGIALPTHEIDGEPRRYQVNITHPMTSVFRSQSYSIDEMPQTIEFSPRTILRGTIECDAEIDGCSPVGAVVIAERLRMPDEGGPLGPYFYWQVTHATALDADGALQGAAFALPVNPGVYVVTALPASGSAGGPAELSIVDLRNGAPGVSDGNVKVLELDDPIALRPGRPVRLELRDFDRGAQVRPIDTGSFLGKEGFVLPDVGTPVDLNDSTTCYSANPTRACQIRSLVRPDVGALSLLQNKRVQFLTRSGGVVGCG